jgi:catechol 2,3-dioxygenase-like lactoylglutathione lyase family enzyme
MPIRRVNHVVLSVSDIEASARFYTVVLGLRVAAELPETPTWPAMVFLRSPHDTTNHHDIGLIENATSAAEDLSAMLRPGLFHVALEVGTLDELEAVRDQLEAVDAHQVSLDQGMHLSVYGRDPDGISVEIIWRVPKWSEEEEMYRIPLDFALARKRWGGQLATGAAAGEPA